MGNKVVIAASHVAALPSWASMTMDRVVLEIEPGRKSEVFGSRAQLREAFDKCAAEARRRIAATNDEEWAKTWTLKFAGKDVLSMRRATVMRATVMKHLIHHRAQLGRDHGRRQALRRLS